MCYLVVFGISTVWYYNKMRSMEHAQQRVPVTREAAPPQYIYRDVVVPVPSPGLLPAKPLPPSLPMVVPPPVVPQALPPTCPASPRTISPRRIAAPQLLTVPAKVRAADTAPPPSPPLHYTQRSPARTPTRAHHSYIHQSPIIAASAMVDKRIDASDGNPYTFQEFIDCYGEGPGELEWNHSRDFNDIGSGIASICHHSDPQRPPSCLLLTSLPAGSKIGCGVTVRGGLYILYDHRN